MPAPFPLTGGATLTLVAETARSWGRRSHLPVMERWNVDDYVALDWILQAQEKGLDVGMPRDKKRGARTVRTKFS